MGFGNVYYGLAQRALDLTIESVKSKTSLGLTRSMAYHAEVQHRFAEMAMEMEAIEPQLDRVAARLVDGVDHGAAWTAKIVAAKYHAVEGAWRVVDRSSIWPAVSASSAGGLERLFRDARLGRIHPANAMLTHEFVAKTRWGSTRTRRHAGARQRPWPARRR